MEVIGRMDGVYVVENIVARVVPVGVKLQTGIIISLALMILSAVMLFAAMISCFATPNR